MRVSGDSNLDSDWYLTASQPLQGPVVPTHGSFLSATASSVSKARPAPNVRTGFQEERVNQPSAGAPMGNLQFDHVERDGSPSSLTCAACNQAIATSYYEVNGSVTCQPCRNQIMAGGRRGSSGRRVAKALALGLGAAVVGAAVYFGLAGPTRHRVGLLGVVVGPPGGGAGRQGSHR